MFDELKDLIQTRKRFVNIRKRVDDNAKHYIREFVGILEQMALRPSAPGLQVTISQDEMGFVISDPQKVLLPASLRFTFKVELSETKEHWVMRGKSYSWRDVTTAKICQVPDSETLFAQNYNEAMKGFRDFVTNAMRDVLTH